VPLVLIVKCCIQKLSVLNFAWPSTRENVSPHENFPPYIHADLMYVSYSEEAREYVEIGSLNGLFVLGRTVGFIGKSMFTIISMNPV